MATARNAPPPPAKMNPGTAAALFGGTVAVATGAWFGTRALARRNGDDRKPVNAAMATAMTACDVAHAKSEPPIATEPAVPHEPRV